MCSLDPHQLRFKYIKAADLLHLDIHGTPPDVVLASFLVDNSLVLGTSTSLLAGEVYKSSI